MESNNEIREEIISQALETKEGKTTKHNTGCGSNTGMYILLLIGIVALLCIIIIIIINYLLLLLLLLLLLYYYYYYYFYYYYHFILCLCTCINIVIGYYCIFRNYILSRRVH